MDKVNLKIGDIFSQAWKGCSKPMWFKIQEIDRATNYILVECHSFDGHTVFPEPWSLDSTEAGFEIGDYKLAKQLYGNILNIYRRYYFHNIIFIIVFNYKIIMCWKFHGKAKSKVATKDLTVYKIVRNATSRQCESYYQKYIYNLDLQPSTIIVPDRYTENLTTIHEGYHSYQAIENVTNPSDILDYRLFKWSGEIYAIYKKNTSMYVATFIIPKNTKYYINEWGDIVSEQIKYTGKFLEL